MEINICEDKKMVEVWFKKAESDPGLKSLCARCRERGYLVAVFKSGGEDLASLTAGLLIHNRNSMA